MTNSLELIIPFRSRHAPRAIGRKKIGAGNGTRTRDPKLGRLALYHLSYSRKIGGEGRIRTFEGIAGRFTVCSLWPLGNLSPSLCNHNFASARPSRTLLRQLDRFSLELAIGFEPTTC